MKDNKIISEGISIGNKLNDPTSHGEMSVIRNVCRNIQSADLTGAMLYASMQPCIMCLGAAMWSALARIVYACSKDKVSSEYYGGNYRIDDINENFLHPIELTHFSELEEESLAIVRQWENGLALTYT